MDVLLRLQRWYAAQGDGDWEHQYGVYIGTLGNPGWMVTIELTGTSLENKPFEDVTEKVGSKFSPDSSRWIDCVRRDNEWYGLCDETQLARVIEIFLEWAGE